MKRITSFFFFLIILTAPVLLFAQNIPENAEDISPLLIGETVPNSKVLTAKGKSVNLNKILDGKPTVLVFYRGGWCPFCNIQLAALQEAMSELNDLGYQIAAVSTDAPDKASKTLSKKKLYYTLLADPDVSLAKKFGIAYKAPERYKNKLTKSSDGKNTELLLPVPSVFILDKKGVIRFEYLNPDYKTRLSSKMLLGNARILAAEK